MWMYGTAWWMWLLMGAGTIGFWVLVAVTVKALLDDRRPEPATPSTPVAPVTPDPARVLDGRLARGEIDAEEYLRLRRLIQHGHWPDEPVADQPVRPDRSQEP